MHIRSRHPEVHFRGRSGWLRAAVLGSNDAIVSTASLMVGVAAADASRTSILTAGIAGLCAGAMSMAAGEYVSVSSQRDTELADIRTEAGELAENPAAELEELRRIYVHRGLDAELATRVATDLMAHDALGAHLRDELGIERGELARPLQAAWVSAVSFALFALLPVLAVWVAPAAHRLVVVFASTLVCLAALGAAGSRVSGASLWRATLRVTLGGAAAMAVTLAVGEVVGRAIG